MIDPNALAYIAVSIAVAAVATFWLCYRDNRMTNCWFRLYCLIFVLWPVLVPIAIAVMVAMKVASVYKEALRKPFRGNIDRPNDLAEVFADHGIRLSPEEAALVLDYVTSHDYTLYVRPDGQIMRHDLDAGESCADELYGIHNIIYFVSDMNDEFIKICEGGESSYDIEDLRHDEAIFAAIIDRYHARKEGVAI